MDRSRKLGKILYADDDEDDQILVSEALAEAEIYNPIDFVGDGEELLHYLKNKEKYTDKKKYEKPDFILLDLNMPKKDGREALAEIKADPELRKIPIVILTTSKVDEDIVNAYDLGVNSFITKPASFDSLVEIMKMLTKYWLEIVKLPIVRI